MSTTRMLTISSTAFFTRALLNAEDPDFVSSAVDLARRGIPGLNRLSAGDERTFKWAVDDCARSLWQEGTSPVAIASALVVCAELFDRVPADIALACIADPDSALNKLATFGPQRSWPSIEDEIVILVISFMMDSFAVRAWKHSAFRTHLPSRVGAETAARARSRSTTQTRHTSTAMEWLRRRYNSQPLPAFSLPSK